MYRQIKDQSFILYKYIIPWNVQADQVSEFYKISLKKLMQKYESYMQFVNPNLNSSGKVWYVLQDLTYDSIIFFVIWK